MRLSTLCPLVAIHAESNFKLHGDLSTTGKKGDVILDLESASTAIDKGNQALRIFCFFFFNALIYI